MTQPFLCKRISEQLTIDGDLDKTAWSGALRTSRFGAIDNGDLGFFDTRTALLWDERALYAAFWVEERDVYCTRSERTGLTWSENTVELYIAGPDAYYTLAVAPDGRRSEMFFIWKDAYSRGSRYDVPEFDLAVHKPMVFGGDGGPHLRNRKLCVSTWCCTAVSFRLGPYASSNPGRTTYSASNKKARAIPNVFVSSGGGGA